MFWSNFLHIYQPSNQMPYILEKIVNESYREIIKGLKNNPSAKITLNINSCLTEMLIKRGYQDIVSDLRTLAQKGQIEFTGSAKYHAFLPFLPETEIKRQIELNYRTNRRIFGSIYNPKGFFPPELAINSKVVKIVAQAGYKWILADEIAYNGKLETLPHNQIYSVKGFKDFKIFFRERRMSELILGAIIRSEKTMLEALGERINEKNQYLLTAMDGETFGHHRPGLQNLLFEIYGSKKYDKITISELLDLIPKSEKPISPLASSWSTSKEEIIKKRQFMAWKNPKNKIHRWQWQLTKLVLSEVNKLDKKSKSYRLSRLKLDRALQSDHYWWASARPWWSLEMIEGGANQLLETILAIKNLSPEIQAKANDLYQKILIASFEWQRSGYIHRLHSKKKNPIDLIPLKNRVTKKWFDGLVKELQNEMKKAADNEEFEKAIMWRDAIFKLKSGQDIYADESIAERLKAEKNIPSLDYLDKQNEK